MSFTCSVFIILFYIVIHKICQEKVANEEVFKLREEKKIVLTNTLHKKVNWTGHILRKNCLLRDTIEGQVMEVKGVERRTQVLDYSRNIRSYWGLKEEPEDKKKKKMRKRQLSQEHKDELYIFFPQVQRLVKTQDTLIIIIIIIIIPTPHMKCNLLEMLNKKKLI